MAQKLIFFKDIDKNMGLQVGGKGANLGEMSRADFPVPDGFCLTTDVYRDFVQGLLLKDLSAEDARKALLAHQLPDYLHPLLANALQMFPEDSMFSVRSSATAEDLPFASFAGQQDTYLNIPVAQLADSIHKCFASLFTDRAVEYRKKNQVKTPMMAVVVQQMIHSDVSGILFTADPVTGNRHLTVIDAGFGLGEALVAGLVTPDHYTVDKRKDNIRDKETPIKQLAIYPMAGGGIQQVTIHNAQQVLTDEQIIALSGLGKRLEQHYGCPQDVEWAIENGIVYILQTRPITSLFPLPEPHDDFFHMFFCVNYVQMNLNAFPRLAAEIFRCVLRQKDVSIYEYDSDVVRLAGGRTFVDLSALYAYYPVRKLAPKLLRFVDPLAAEAIKELLSRNPQFHREKLTIPKYLKQLPGKIIHRFQKEDTRDTVNLVNNLIKQIIESRTQAIRQAAPGPARLEAIYQNISLSKILIANAAPYLGPALLSMLLMERAEKKIFGAAIYTPDIEAGLEGNVTTEMGLKICDLADLLLATDGLLDELKNSNYDTLMDRINARNDAFSQAFSNIMGTYGCRCAGELDISIPRWREDPEPFVKQLIAMAETKQPGDHRTEYARTTVWAKEQAEAFVSAVEEKKGKRKAAKVAHYVDVFRNAMPIREHFKFMIIQIMDVARNALLEEAATMVQRGQLAAPDDIFHLSLGELYSALQENLDCRELADKRKEEFRHFKKLTPPRILTSDGETLMGSYRLRHLPPNSLPGEPVSAGVVEGIAKVVLDPKESVVNQDEILVAPFTDPGWTILFVHASAVVTEIGGRLTHGAVVAREYGIPGVVGVTDATKLIKTGQRIRVNGTLGYVELLE